MKKDKFVDVFNLETNNEERPIPSSDKFVDDFQSRDENEDDDNNNVSRTTAGTTKMTNISEIGTNERI